MGILGTGASLVETLVPLGLANVATKLVEAIAINSISERIRRKRPVVVKRHNIDSEQLAELTNLYFSVSGIPIRFWSKVQDWQRWEVDCFEVLNGDRFHARPSGPRTVIEDKLPGKVMGVFESRYADAAHVDRRRV